MRALWFVRRNLTQHPGGDTTQILQTAAALRALGVQVVLTDDPAAPLAGFDVVHLFHLDRLWENEPISRRARAAGRPVALSTIYWPADEFDRGGRVGFQGWLARRLGSAAYQNLRLVQRGAMHAVAHRALAGLTPRTWSFRRAARRLLAAAAVVLPNSRAEQEEIERRLDVRRPTVVVPNAVDVRAFGPPGADESEPRSGVLCVGRIEPRKNQLALIEALRGSDVALTIVGQVGRFSRRYGARCRRAAGPNVRFVEHRSPDELRAFYRQARVHACVSWYETPGLASLEAALSGCALVVTPGGCTSEYFGADAHYCRADDPASIRQAVVTALSAGTPPTLAQRIAREFTWEQAAAKTREGYELALSASSTGPPRWQGA